MSEVGFYHLTETPLEAVLPVMLERARERGWRAELRCPGPERLEAVDALLWTRGDASFLPHGRADAAHAARQPILLSLDALAEDIGGSGAKRAALFVLDDAPFAAEEAVARTRTALVFDGHVPDVVETARGRWRAVAAAGLTAVYWAQAPGGRWQEKARSG